MRIYFLDLVGVWGIFFFSHSSVGVDVKDREFVMDIPEPLNPRFFRVLSRFHLQIEEVNQF